MGTFKWTTPFHNFKSYVIAIEICHGKRETPVENTPLEYQQFYQQCWDGEPDLRPDINKVHEELNKLKSQFGSQSESSLKDGDPNESQTKVLKFTMTVKEWIDNKIKNSDIIYFEYSKFSNVNEIARGAFGIVSKANLTSMGLEVALKSSISEKSKIDKNNLDELNELVKEVSLHTIHYHCI